MNSSNGSDRKIFVKSFCFYFCRYLQSFNLTGWFCAFSASKRRTGMFLGMAAPPPNRSLSDTVYCEWLLSTLLQSVTLVKKSLLILTRKICVSVGASFFCLIRYPLIGEVVNMHTVASILQPRHTKSTQVNIGEFMSTLTPKQLFTEVD